MVVWNPVIDDADDDDVCGMWLCWGMLGHVVDSRVCGFNRGMVVWDIETFGKTKG